MRAGISANNPEGEFGSPHMSIPMNGDVAKIIPLTTATTSGRDVDVVADGGDGGASTAECRDNIVNSSTGNARSGVVVTEDKTRHHSSSLTVMHQMGTPEVGSTTQLIGGTDDIFRRNHTTPTWSNVVSTSKSRSFSSETLLTSNMADAHPLTTLDGANTRSRSFSFESPSHHYMSKSLSFSDTATTTNQRNNCPGILQRPSHPDHSPCEDSSYHNSPTMYPSTPYFEYKPRGDSMGSREDSMTERTSPMSSPSLSPRASPAMHSRRHIIGDDPPLMWQLSDANNDCHHPEPATPRHRIFYQRMQQSIPEENNDPDVVDRHRDIDADFRPGRTRSGLISPPNQNSPGVYRLHPSMYPRRVGANPSAQMPPHHRSSTEILKTLLRKKACLYEPDTSLAVSLVTWLVGRRIALDQGYFTRQQLQAGVHSCVTGKIDEGRVTRTKVNRCMQVILNSCFHYIIPLPDGREECGGAFRSVFSREAADEEDLLELLPPPWNGLNLQSTNDDYGGTFHHDEDGDHHHSYARIHQGKDSSAASQADESLDSQKRSVLLCFNENIRCAADVFRCHNEFIRDIAHMGNLNLSPEEWRSFFSGTKVNTRRGAMSENFHTRYFHLADVHDRMDQQGLAKLRTSWCAKRYEHDHSFCAFAHADINRGWLRRDPFVDNYAPQMCPCIKPLQGAEDCYVNMCPHGVKCIFAHSREEILYHPECYKRHPCRHAPGSCQLGDICPNTHSEASTQAHGYNRQGKRHYQDVAPFTRFANSGSKRRGAATTENSVGLGKFPDASPMLYIEPAPLSEFEKTLSLPGLQALFRDHSYYLFHSTLDERSPREYGPFGYKTDGHEQKNQLHRAGN
ncbi:hypothetical protein ACHAXA_010617 [Cyclostephanos tholiformis]|uniref:C3H1-type domain-containing protein n=1 Tax=Cyclostephanos tholiformis TaxID=382380 RepID=A0ABD3RFF6_9STRA